MGFQPSDYLIKKRRYSAFFGTDFEILLRGLKIDTLLLCGGLTDVCVHYTFVDGHQSDYFCWGKENCIARSSEEAHEAALRGMEYLWEGARRSLNEVPDGLDGFAEFPLVVGPQKGIIPPKETTLNNYGLLGELTEGGKPTKTRVFRFQRTFLLIFILFFKGEVLPIIKNKKLWTRFFRERYNW